MFIYTGELGYDICYLFSGMRQLSRVEKDKGQEQQVFSENLFLGIYIYI